jgi:putative acetyltransferase
MVKTKIIDSPGVPEINKAVYGRISFGRPLMVIENEHPEDIQKIHELNGIAFGRETEAVLVDKLRASKALTLSLVAMEEGSIVGHIAFSPVTINTVDQIICAIGLGPIAVSPGRQRSGIGSHLVEAGLNEIKRLGHRIVIVIGNPEYYSRFGFLPAGKFGIRWEFDVPDEVFMVKELSEHALQGVKVS